MQDQHSKPTPPLDWIRDLANSEPGRWTGLQVLDLACGSGRHGRLFLAAGARVHFIDRNPEGTAYLDAAENAERVICDLENGPWPLQGMDTDLVIVTNYLWRPRFKEMLRLVRPGGYLAYQTFGIGNEAFGKPSNPDFLLEEGELPKRLNPEFEVLDYFHGEVETPKPAIIQRVLARRHER